MTLFKRMLSMFEREPYPKKVKLGERKEAPTIDAEAFWKTVIACLVEFHGKSEKEARDLVGSFYARAITIPPERREGALLIVYHNEPFYKACDLVGKQLEIEPYDKQYKAIYERHGW